MTDNFYVPDEPLADAVAAYETGDKGVTIAPPQTTRSGVAKVSNKQGFLSLAASNWPRLGDPSWTRAAAISR